jgi:thioredoxin-related protein
MQKLLQRFGTTVSLLVLFTLLFTLGIVANPAKSTPDKTAEKSAQIEWFNYSEGLEKAEKEGKYVVVDFYTNWCGWCKRMDKSTFQDPEVVDFINNKMVAVKVNAEAPDTVVHQDVKLTERQLAIAVYKATGYPTYFFLDPQGKALFKVPGYRNAEDFLNLVQFVGEEHYKNKSFDKFLQMKKSTDASK